MAGNDSFMFEIPGLRHVSLSGADCIAHLLNGLFLWLWSSADYKDGAPLPLAQVAFFRLTFARILHSELG